MNKDKKPKLSKQSDEPVFDKAAFKAEYDALEPLMTPEQKARLRERSRTAPPSNISPEEKERRFNEIMESKHDFGDEE